MKVVTLPNANEVDEERSIPKPLVEWTEEDKKEVHDDKKEVKILFNILDKDMHEAVRDQNLVLCTLWCQFNKIKENYICTFHRYNWITKNMNKIHKKKCLNLIYKKKFLS